MKPRINVITVAVDDLEKSLAFYRDSLGWRPRWPAEGTVEPFDHVAFELQSGLSFVLYPAMRWPATLKKMARGQARRSLSSPTLSAVERRLRRCLNAPRLVEPR